MRKLGKIITRTILIIVGSFWLYPGVLFGPHTLLGVINLVIGGSLVSLAAVLIMLDIRRRRWEKQTAEHLETQEVDRILCSNCGSDLPSVAGFCPKCGASVLEPTFGSYVEAFPEGSHPVTASAIVYLFSDHFVEVKKRGTTVPCKDIKVNSYDLAQMVVAAAYIWLEKNGFVTLSILERKAFPGISKIDYVIVVKKRPVSQIDPASLEWKIQSQMKEEIDVSENNAYQLTVKGIGGQIGITRAVGLVDLLLREKGYLWERKTVKKGWIRKKTVRELVPHCEKISELEEHIEDVKSMISSFRERKPEVYNQLFKDINKANSALQPPEPPGFD